jgi:ribosomal protein S18 acetylase RimI-like enzyme
VGRAAGNAGEFGTGGGSLRTATEADVPRLTELVRAAYGHYVERLGGPPRPMTDDYADVVRRYRVTVAERRGEIVGLIVLGVSDEGFFVDNVAVDPSHQRSGVGRALLVHAEDAARRAGFRLDLPLHPREDDRNLALYARIGYVAYDRRRHEEACRQSPDGNDEKAVLSLRIPA